ncbi:hypothetical protein AM493_02630 [Flavobacterium akiainvivens]|uniref:Response regulatory domain-containing protein n=1 Tax=Flavobacterium akiainvivens TaxID=1202724 RepID=A0A0M9VH08_9FLAO|nr:response regulator [Flavobacterium akiainvivens]KOS05050.1 hypothetical protein AM493_02630 [Flavobacterium akiainvivens]SFQ52193.1 Response regulator receiver domain-containing protein [Flavobacterium akiainvivens]
MTNTTHTIMLIDDNKIDNLFHARVVKKHSDTIEVIVKDSAEDGLEYLSGNQGAFPDIIFLDINMPGMSGWDFLEAFRKLEQNSLDTLIMVMLGTFETATPEMQTKIDGLFAGFAPKPLTKETVDEVMARYNLKQDL